MAYPQPLDLWASKLKRDEDGGDMMKHNKHRVAATVSRPFPIRNYPTATTAQTIFYRLPLDFNIQKVGYLSPTAAGLPDSYLEFTLSFPAVANGYARVFPFAAFEVANDTVNGSLVSAYSNRRDRYACEMVKSQTHQENFNSKHIGIPFSATTPPFPPSNALPKSAHSIAALAPGGVVGTPSLPVGGANVVEDDHATFSLASAISKRFCVPLKYFLDCYMADSDDCVNLCYLDQNLIRLYMNDPNRWIECWTVAVSGSPGSYSYTTTPFLTSTISITLSNVYMILQCVQVDASHDQLIRSMMDGPGVTYALQGCASFDLSRPEFTSSSSGLTAIELVELPQSTKYLEMTFESSALINNAAAAYRLLTTINPGIYQYLLQIGGKNVTQDWVQVVDVASGAPINQIEGYQNYLNEVAGRKTGDHDWDCVEGTGIDFKTFQGSSGMTGSGALVEGVGKGSIYPTFFVGSPNAGGLITAASYLVPPPQRATQFDGGFRIVADLSSIEREEYSGEQGSRLVLQTQYSGYAGCYDAQTDGQFDLITGSININTLAYFNRIVNVTRNACRILV